jgi:hypothetical protein
MPADLQSALVGRLSIPADFEEQNGADERIRTADPLFTKQPL